jgi:hypothetical protein
MADSELLAKFKELFPPARKARSFDRNDAELSIGARQKTCRCGKTFFARDDVRFCSRRCQQDDRNQIRRERRAEREPDLVACANPQCGVAFQPTRSTARYCSNRCRQAMHRASERKAKAKVKPTKRKGVRRKRR